jgi:2-oxoglutarate/2-oxoacid ferredoxin oxidoreductase subunit alpha
VVGWGSTYGAIRVAVGRARARGSKVSHIHIRNVWPLPPNLGELLSGFRKVLVPELNAGQLSMLLRSELLLDVTPYQGRGPALQGLRNDRGHHREPGGDAP